MDGMDDFENTDTLGSVEDLLRLRKQRRDLLQQEAEQSKANPFADILLGLGGGLAAGLEGRSGQAGAQAAIGAYERAAGSNVAKRLAALDKEGSDIKILADLAKAKQSGQLGYDKLANALELAGAKGELSRTKDELKRSEKQKSEQEKGAEKAGKALEPVDAMMSQVGDIEGMLGQSGIALDTYKPGQKVDLPGVSLPGVGRITAYSPEARNFKSAFDSVFNTLLKERSGAAVTDSELRRLASEFGQGQFNTEEDMVGALKRLKTGLARQRARTEGRYSADVVSQLRERQGAAQTGVPILQQQSQPQTKVIGGVTYQKVGGGWQRM